MELIGCQSETVVKLPWAADCCPWVGKLRTLLPLTVGLGDAQASQGGNMIGNAIRSYATGEGFVCRFTGPGTLPAHTNKRESC